MTNGVTLDDEQWEEEALEARHKSLDNVRATAKSWTESMGLILGAFTTAAFIKGPEALEDVPGGFSLTVGPWAYDPARTVGNVVLLGALALAAAFGLAALAAQGTPGWVTALTGPVYKTESAKSARKSIWYLKASRLTTLVAAALILIGMAMAWTAEVEKPAGVNTTSAIVNAGGRPICGALATASDGSLSVTPEGAAVIAIDAGSPVTIVDDCP